MALDPQAANVIELVIKSGRPPYHQLTPKDARQMFRETRPASTPPAPQIGAVRELMAEGSAGPIPLRLYRPAGLADSRRLPVLVYFHGGGWVIGDLETHDVLCRQLTAEAGVSVVAVDYRLAPEHKFPAAVEDCLAAYQWVRGRGRDIGADPERGAVAGDSAGGNLAAVVSQSAAAAGVPVPTCQVLIYPALDFSLDTESHRDLELGHIIPRERIEWYAQQYLGSEADKTDLRASPLRAPSLAGQPPSMIVTAGFDPLRDEGRDYADRLRAAGVEVVYREYPGQIHAFVSLTKAIPQGLACTLETAEYLRRQLR
jgi:acetyl esterase